MPLLVLCSTSTAKNNKGKHLGWQEWFHKFIFRLRTTLKKHFPAHRTMWDFIYLLMKSLFTFCARSGVLYVRWCVAAQRAGIMLNAPFLAPHYISGPLSVFNCLQFKLESGLPHRALVYYFHNTLKFRLTPILANWLSGRLLFEASFTEKPFNPLSFTVSGTRRPFRLLKQ